jgi:oligopeptide/dipeptide ABC transporter ATP-binding protein
MASSDASLIDKPVTSVPGRETPVVELTDVSLHVITPDGQRLKIVEHIGFSVGPSRFFAVIGESGSGKTMIARAIMRLIPDEIIAIDGSIRFCGEEIATAPESRMRQLRGSGISMIFQEPMSSLNPLMTVERQIGEAIDAHARVTKEERRRRILKMLADVQFRDPEATMRAFPHELSGGMRQRVMVAMALVNTPRLLIADEPTTALDVTIQKEVLEIIKHLSEAYRLAVLFISHDVSLVYEYADEIAVLYGGVLMERGPTRSIVRRPAHPYTAALLDCVPSRRVGGVRQRGIEGSVPSVSRWQPGCRFQDRCGRRRPECASPAIELRQLEDRAVRCVAPITAPGGSL